MSLKCMLLMEGTSLQECGQVERNGELQNRKHFKVDKGIVSWKDILSKTSGSSPQIILKCFSLFFIQSFVH